jgi:hypothetical protein
MLTKWGVFSHSLIGHNNARLLKYIDVRSVKAYRLYCYKIDIKTHIIIFFINFITQDQGYKFRGNIILCR